MCPHLTMQWTRSALKRLNKTYAGISNNLDVTVSYLSSLHLCYSNSTAAITEFQMKKLALSSWSLASDDIPQMTR